MHEDCDTEGFIPASVGAGVPDIPEYGRLSCGPRQAGLLQLGREALPSAKVQVQMGVVGLCNIVIRDVAES